MSRTKFILILLSFLLVFSIFIKGEDKVKKSNPDLPFPKAIGFDSWLNQDIVLNTGVNPGFSDSWEQDIVCQGNYIYVTYEDTRNGDEDIYFNYSTDRGATWLKKDIRLNTGVSPGSNTIDDPKIAVSGENVYVVWMDYRNNKESIYFNYSSDRGATWQASDMRLDHSHRGSSEVEDYPLICASGSRVYVVWSDDRNNISNDDNDIFFNYSKDYGATWQKYDTQINTHTGDDQFDPSICCSGDKVYIVWADERYSSSNEDVFFNYSHDGGTTWLASDKRINRDPIGKNDIDDAEIACSGDKVYVSWEDNRNGNRDDIYFNCSHDGGMTWQATDIRVDTNGPGAGASDDAEIACSGDNVYLVWEDERNGRNNNNIYFNYSHDGGLTWGASDQRLASDTPGAFDQEDVVITCSGNQIHVAWESDRIGGNDVTFYNYSLDGGITWQASDIQVNKGNGDCDDPAICCTPDYVAVVWEEDRNHSYNEDIYFNTVNHAPSASVGASQTVSVLSEVYLDGTASSDPDGDDLQFQWTFNSVPIGTITGLHDTQNAIAAFKPDQLGVYKVKLEVTDPFGKKNSKIVNIRAIIPPPVYFTGQRVTNRSLSQTEHIDVLTWEAPGNYNLAGYIIYRVQNGTHTQLAEVGGGIYKYTVRDSGTGEATYAIRGKDAQGTLSEAVMVTVSN